MAIVELRILPPLAIGRLGSSEVPLEAFDLEVRLDQPLGYRRIVPRPTFRVDPATGEMSCYTPASIRFKEEDGRVRPLAPFLQVFAVTDAAPEELQPLTTDLLASEGLGVDAVGWTVEVANIKIFRRTGQPGDKIVARVEGIRDHTPKPLLGECPNFLRRQAAAAGHRCSSSSRRRSSRASGSASRPRRGKVYGASRTRTTGRASRSPTRSSTPTTSSSTTRRRAPGAATPRPAGRP